MIVLIPGAYTIFFIKRGHFIIDIFIVSWQSTKINIWQIYLGFEQLQKFELSYQRFSIFFWWYNNSNLCINHSKNIATLCFGTFHSFLVGLDRNWVYGSCYILCPKGLWSSLNQFSKADNRSQELNICNVCAHHYNPLLNTVVIT